VCDEQGLVPDDIGILRARLGCRDRSERIVKEVTKALSVKPGRWRGESGFCPTGLLDIIILLPHRVSTPISVPRIPKI
jgi:hypothetical protein